MYFLRPEYRGLGIGLPLWDKAITADVENKALIAGRHVQIERKRKSGFAFEVLDLKT